MHCHCVVSSIQLYRDATEPCIVKDSVQDQEVEHRPLLRPLGPVLETIAAI